MVPVDGAGPARVRDARQAAPAQERSTGLQHMSARLRLVRYHPRAAIGGGKSIAARAWSIGLAAAGAEVTVAFEDGEPPEAHGSVRWAAVKHRGTRRAQFPVGLDRVLCGHDLLMLVKMPVPAVTIGGRAAVVPSGTAQEPARLPAQHDAIPGRQGAGHHRGGRYRKLRAGDGGLWRVRGEVVGKDALPRHRGSRLHRVAPC